MVERKYDDEARDRLAAIRARRGTPERQAQIEALQASKAKSKSMKEPSSGAGGRKTPDNSADFFGHPWPLWYKMRDAGYAHIEECARRRQMTTYADLWAAVTAQLDQELGNPWRQIDHLLGHISEHAHEKDGVMLTALVMYEGAGERTPVRASFDWQKVWVSSPRGGSASWRAVEGDDRRSAEVLGRATRLGLRSFRCLARSPTSRRLSTKRHRRDRCR